MRRTLFVRLIDEQDNKADGLFQQTARGLKMPRSDISTEQAARAIPGPEQADIIVGIASYNNARTIGHVVRAVDAGLAKYFPSQKAIIVNSDGGSSDSTPEAVLGASVDHKAIFLSHRLTTVNRIPSPYHGIPGKGSAFKAIFEMAASLNAKACCVVDADLRSITPEWMELLLSPVYKEAFDFVAPLYTRHKYDGTITNSIIYPLTRALYGRKIRQPIGGDFGFSGEMAMFYLHQDVLTHDSKEVPTFGFKYSVGVVPIRVNTEGMLRSFRIGAENLKEVWAGFMDKPVVDWLLKISHEEAASFRFPKETWVGIVYDYILAYHHKKLQAEHLLKSLIPLYHGRTASFFLETMDMGDDEAEQVVEDVAAEYENQKGDLAGNW